VLKELVRGREGIIVWAKRLRAQLAVLFGPLQIWCWLRRRAGELAEPPTHCKRNVVHQAYCDFRSEGIRWGAQECDRRLTLPWATRVVRFKEKQQNVEQAFTVRRVEVSRIALHVKREARDLEKGSQLSDGLVFAEGPEVIDGANQRHRVFKAARGGR